MGFLIAYLAFCTILWNAGFRKTVMFILYFTAAIISYILIVCVSGIISFVFEDFRYFQAWQMPSSWVSELINIDNSMGKVLMLLPLYILVDIFRISFSFAFTTPLIVPKIFIIAYFGILFTWAYAFLRAWYLYDKRTKEIMRELDKDSSSSEEEGVEYHNGMRYKNGKLDW